MVGVYNEGVNRWAIVLHLYQPPTQDPDITRTVWDRCYGPLVRELVERDKVRMTFNLSGGLVRQLAGLGAEEFLGGVKKLVKAGRVELLNSPIYHPVIPITPDGVWKRQVEENKRVTREILGVETGEGFFPPELGVNEESVKEIRGLGYDTILTDGGQDHEICEITRAYPGRFSGRKLGEWVKKKYASGETIVSVHDAEVFGHHYEERLEVLTELWDDKSWEFITLRESGKAKAASLKGVKAGTWQNEPGLDLWTGNELQKKYLELGRMAAGMWDEFGPNAQENIRASALKHLDMGWSSCHLYWLSNRPWWHPGLAEMGANNLIKCVRSLPMDFKEKAAAEQLYHGLLEQMWLMHWEGKQDEGFRKYDQERQKLLAELPDLG